MPSPSTTWRPTSSALVRRIHFGGSSPSLRERLIGQGLETGGSRTQIVPVLVGDARRAMALCERTLEGGVFAQAIRPPTVPDGSSRLRLTVMANHRAEELRHAAQVIGGAARELGVAAGDAQPGRARALRRAA